MSRITTYELVLIFDSNVEAEQIEHDLRKIHDLVQSHGGKFRRWERWGKRRLTYEIRHRQYGVYVLTVYDLATSETHELDRLLHLTTSLLRHLVTVVDPERVPEVDDESVASLGAAKQVEPELDSTPSMAADVLDVTIDDEIEDIVDEDTETAGVAGDPTADKPA
ncbi:30S ribosomal protein S6 [bacterium]|nr:30S ribosomal protein S6 [bacterium]